MILEDFKDRSGLWVTQVHWHKRCAWTRSGSVWNNMRRRCIPNGRTQSRLPTYVGCTLSDNFKDFQYFVEWSNKQVGFGIDNYQLDKDLLFRGNKMYSEDTCIYVPKPLNMFLCSHNKTRGKYKTGVYYEPDRNKYQAKIQLVNSHKHLGRYGTEDEAHEVYKVAKEAEARRWAARLEAGEYLVDEKLITILRNWTWDSYEQQ